VNHNFKGAQAKVPKTFTDSNFPTNLIHDDRDAQSNMSLGAVSQPDGASPQHENPVRRSQGAEGTSQALHNDSEDASPEVQDPLSHMSDSDRWGLKGWSFMMNNFPDYSALVNGSNITNLGFDLNSSE
jgi:CCR4-NOT transcription complex subunit 2